VFSLSHCSKYLEYICFRERKRTKFQSCEANCNDVLHMYLGLCKTEEMNSVSEQNNSNIACVFA
jgi:hypothetical protein